MSSEISQSLSGVTLLLFYDPAVLVHLSCAGDGKRIFRYIVGYRRARGGITVVGDSDGSDKIGVAPDKNIVSDHRTELVLSVVVDSHRAAAEIDPFTDIAVADLRKV